MSVVTVVGSGPSGLHCARKALDLGHRVRLFDVGFSGEAPPSPGASWRELKEDLEDPVGYFLGENFQGVMQPDSGAEYYAIPPSKDYVFRPVETPTPVSEGFAPLFSWAQGGLAQAWTGGSYPFNEHELKDFPFSYEEIRPFYEEVAADIGMSGADDDLAQFVPFHDNVGQALALDEHAARLLSRYEAKRSRLQRMGCHLGRSRVATLTEDHSSGRGACTYSGRCLWGCPNGALYVPSATLDQLQQRAGFEYVPSRLVQHFEADDAGWVQRLVWRDPRTGLGGRDDVEVLVLAAGALPTTGIYLESIFQRSGERPRLDGLMDNRQVLVPFLSPGMLGRDFDPDSYQYNLLAMGIEAEEAAEYVHCLFTTLKSTLIHPVALSLPVDLKTALWVVRKAHAALGLVNVNFADHRRASSWVGLQTGDRSASRLQVHYEPPEGEARKIKAALGKLKKALRALGALVPPGMVRLRPMGSSVHYAGTLPMTTQSDAGPHTTDADCRSRQFGNLYVADGATYPFLPAKNLTFTLMANASRVATRIDRS